MLTLKAWAHLFVPGIPVPPEQRTQKKFGVREFALVADIEHHQLINIEKGRVDIRISTLIKIAKGLGVEPKELLDFKI